MAIGTSPLIGILGELERSELKWNEMYEINELTQHAMNKWKNEWNKRNNEWMNEIIISEIMNDWMNDWLNERMKKNTGGHYMNEGNEMNQWMN